MVETTAVFFLQRKWPLTLAMMDLIIAVTKRRVIFHDVFILQIPFAVRKARRIFVGRPINVVRAEQHKTLGFATFDIKYSTAGNRLLVGAPV